MYVAVGGVSGWPEASMPISGAQAVGGQEGVGGLVVEGRPEGGGRERTAGKPFFIEMFST